MPTNEPWNDDRLAPNGSVIKDNFAAWFDQSQVLEDDAPLRVFHGTSCKDEFDSFDAQRQGQTAGVGGGYFFTNTHETAMEVYGWRGGRVIEAFLRIVKPLSLDDYIELNKLDRNEEFEDGHLNATNYFDEKSEVILAFAKANGYDGLIWKDKSGDQYACDLYVVFDARQIKSATANNGIYDPDSSSFTDRNWVQQKPDKSTTYPLDSRDSWYGDCAYKEHGGRLVGVSPRVYLDAVRPLIIDEVSREGIDILKQHILDGGRLDPLLIQANGKEDGRHRAHAALELGIEWVPVIAYGTQFSEAPKVLEFIDIKDEKKRAGLRGGPC